MSEEQTTSDMRASSSVLTTRAEPHARLLAYIFTISIRLQACIYSVRINVTSWNLNFVLSILNCKSHMTWKSGCFSTASTQRRTTVGRSLLDEWSVRRRDFYLTTQNTHNRHNIHAPGGIRTHNPSRRAAVDLRLRPRGHWDQHITAGDHFSGCVARLILNWKSDTASRTLFIRPAIVSTAVKLLMKIRSWQKFYFEHR